MPLWPPCEPFLIILDIFKIKNLGLNSLPYFDFLIDFYNNNYKEVKN